MAANDNQRAANDNEKELTREKQPQPTMKPEPDKGFISASERIKLEEQKRESDGKPARESLSGSHGEIADAIYELNKTMRSQVAQTIANSQTNVPTREREAPAPPPKAPAPVPAQDKQPQAEQGLQAKVPTKPIVEKAIGPTPPIDREADRSAAEENRVKRPGSFRPYEQYYGATERDIKQLNQELAKLTAPEKSRAELAPEKPVADPRSGFMHGLVAAIKQLFTPTKQIDDPMPAQSRAMPAPPPAGRPAAAPPVGLIVGRKIEPAAPVVNRSVERRPEPKRETLLGKLQREARQRGDTLEVKLRPGPEKRLERILDIKRPQQPRGPRDPRN